MARAYMVHFDSSDGDDRVALCGDVIDGSTALHQELL